MSNTVSNAVKLSSLVAAVNNATELSVERERQFDALLQHLITTFPQENDEPENLAEIAWQDFAPLQNLTSEAGLYLIQRDFIHLPLPITAYLTVILLARRDTLPPFCIIEAFMEHFDAIDVAHLNAILERGEERKNFWYFLYDGQLYFPLEENGSLHDFWDDNEENFWEMRFYDALFAFWITHPERVLADWDNFELLIDPNMENIIIGYFISESQAGITIHTTSPLALETMITKLFVTIIDGEFFPTAPAFHKIFEELPETFYHALEERGAFCEWFFNSDTETAEELRKQIRESGHFNQTVRNRFREIHPTATERHFPLPRSNAALIIQNRRRFASEIADASEGDVQEPSYKR